MNIEKANAAVTEVSPNVPLLHVTAFPVYAPNYSCAYRVVMVPKVYSSAYDNANYGTKISFLHAFALATTALSLSGAQDYYTTDEIIDEFNSTVINNDLFTDLKTLLNL